MERVFDQENFCKTFLAIVCSQPRNRRGMGYLHGMVTTAWVFGDLPYEIFNELYLIARKRCLGF